MKKETVLSRRRGCEFVLTLFFTIIILFVDVCKTDVQDFLSVFVSKGHQIFSTSVRYSTI